MLLLQKIENYPSLPFAMSVFFITVSNNGLSGIQIALFLVCLIGMFITKQLNRKIYRNFRLFFARPDLPQPITSFHRATVWAFGPTFLLSHFAPKLSLPLCLGVAALYAHPLYVLIKSKAFGEEERAASMKRLEEEQFDVVFFTSGPKDSGYQMNQWIPVAERLDLKMLICTPRQSLVGEFAETTIPVVVARGAESIETIANSGVKVFLYPANPRENAIALRHYELQHFFINHGESDKRVNQSKLLMAYDKLLVAGPLAEQRLHDAGLPVRPDQVIHVGRPQLEIFVGQDTQVGEIRKVLYAPTWEGFVSDANYTSVSQWGIAMLSTLLKDTTIEVVMKPHPFTGNQKSITKKALDEIVAMQDSHSNFKVLDARESIHDQMNWCDLMIADIGSVVNDFLASGKPVIVTSTRGFAENKIHEQFPTTRAAYLLHEGKNITQCLNDISKNDSKAEMRKEVRVQSLGDFPQGSLKRFEEVLKDALGMVISPT